MIRIPLLFFLLSVALLAPGFSQAQAADKAERIGEILEACHASGVFNGVALVADGGKVILHKAYGNADESTRRPLELDDRFYIGSITKQFVALLVLRMQEQGKLSVDDPLSRYVPEFTKGDYSDVTLYHLLTHSSGIPNYTARSDFDAAVPYTEAEMLDFIVQPLEFRAGTRFAYSNSGYYLLGRVLEQVSGMSFGEMLEQEICGPLGMKGTGFSRKWLGERVAKGHWRTVEEEMGPMPDYALETLLSSGGMYSTAADLFTWNEALYGNELLSEASKELLFTPFQGDYACGWRVHKGYDESGERFERHQHGGMIKGYHSFILRRIPPRQCVILLDNNFNQEIQGIKNSIWSVLIGKNGWVPKPKLSNFLFEACANSGLGVALDAVDMNPTLFEERFEIEEYDVNTVGYRLMAAERYEEAELVLQWNRKHYPGAWNVYDSLGELYLKMGDEEEAERMYERSLELNPQNESAVRALEGMDRGEE